MGDGSNQTYRDNQTLPKQDMEVPKQKETVKLYKHRKQKLQIKLYKCNLVRNKSNQLCKSSQSHNSNVRNGSNPFYKRSYENFANVENESVSLSSCSPLSLPNFLTIFVICFFFFFFFFKQTTAWKEVYM